MAVAVVIMWPTTNAMSQGSYQSIWNDNKKRQNKSLSNFHKNRTALRYNDSYHVRQPIDQQIFLFFFFGFLAKIIQHFVNDQQSEKLRNRIDFDNSHFSNSPNSLWFRFHWQMSVDPCYPCDGWFLNAHEQMHFMRFIWCFFGLRWCSWCGFQQKQVLSRFLSASSVDWCVACVGNCLYLLTGC